MTVTTPFATTTPTTDRRTVLKAAGAFAATGAMASTGVNLVHPVAASATTQTRANGRLAVVFVRGGMDALSAVVPYNEGAYYDARPTIAVPDEQVLDLDGEFGMHPALGRLHNLFDEGRFAVIVGAGQADGNRSHFAAQDLWEYGTEADQTDGMGWIGRHLSATASSNDSIFRAVTMGGLVNLSLRGANPINVPSIEQFGLQGLARTLRSSIENAHIGDGAVEAIAARALGATDRVASMSGSSSGSRYAQAFADAAMIFDSDVGTQAISIDVGGGWDTHDEMGTWEEGNMRTLLADLDAYLADFQADLDARGLDDVTTVVMSEFGRRVVENGAGGTDHGWGTHMFVMGGQINGGVFGADAWAGLSRATIGERGDLVPTVDCRDVLGDLIVGAFDGDPDAVFPGHDYKPLGVL